MNVDFSLDKCLSVWEDYRRRGEEITPEELCRDHPDQIDELRRRIRRLEAIGGPVPDTHEFAAVVDAVGVGSQVAITIEGEVVRFQARGVLGEVLVIRDHTLDRELALKRIRYPMQDDPNGQARFLREANITGRLEHPGIVPIHGIGRLDDGGPCYAMRLVRGTTLAEAIADFHANRDGGDEWTLRGLLGRFVVVCNAVAFAHSRRIIHRDIKPMNIMLGPFGETILLDWGLAKPLDEPGLESLDSGAPGADDGMTDTGAILGTPAYMSPEQAIGSGEIGASSDIYSLGSTFYAILTGRSPFAGKPIRDLIEGLKRSDFPRPRAIRRDIPKPLEAIAIKAMALDPARRYATAQDLAADVERWLADEPVKALRESIGEKFLRLLRRRPALTTWGFLCLVVDWIMVTEYIDI